VPPPPHWRLFEPGGKCVRVVPPKTPALDADGSVAVSAASNPRSRLFRQPTGPVVFGETRSLQAPVPRWQLESDERLCDLDAEDLGAEAVRLHRLLRSCGFSLLDCLVRSPSEHPRYLRRFRQLGGNMISLLHRMRTRETRGLVVHHLRRSVSEKRVLVEFLRRGLPGLHARVAVAVAHGASAEGAEQGDHGFVADGGEEAKNRVTAERLSNKQR